MSSEYSDEELREIEDHMEVPDNQYVRWIRLHHPLIPKRKRKVKQYNDTIQAASQNLPRT